MSVNRLDKELYSYNRSQMTLVNILFYMGVYLLNIYLLFCMGAYLIRACAVETTQERTWQQWRTNGYSPIQFCEPYWWRIRWTTMIFASSRSHVPFPFPFSLNSSCSMEYGMEGCYSPDWGYCVKIYVTHIYHNKICISMHLLTSHWCQTICLHG